MAINLKGYRITVLCEDINQYDFICAYAKLLGANKAINRILTAYNNATVLKYYSKAVTDYRKFAQQNFILAVMLDADEKTVNERIREFDKELDEEKYRLNKPTRLDSEKILIFVPIRNIESWLHYIVTNTITVETLKGDDGKTLSYKNLYPNKEMDFNKLVKQLKEDICLNSLPGTIPSSLHYACNELKRLEY